ncbi:McrB family protein [Geomicrobium sp. JSM 1781026]|uniref:McrB family protein n=1 Tax=Geomicrobium sp. JSM 1781026 TaxID=3344580 RepID=UPI0035C25EE6
MLQLNSGVTKSIPFETFNNAYNDLLGSGNYDFDDQDESLYVASLLSGLPFIDVSDGDQKLVRKTFDTEDLPVSSVKDVLVFLDELAEGTYTPDRLSEELKGNQNLYRRKTGARQTLRMLGILDQNHQGTIRFGNQSDRNEHIKKNVSIQPFFQFVMALLEMLQHVDKDTARGLLLRVVGNVVRNSRGENSITESVAEKRLAHTLDWLYSFNFIDKNNRPKQGDEENMDTNLRETFANILADYTEATSEKFSKENPVYQLVNHTASKELKKLPFVTDQYIVKTSVGQGNWTFTPWIAFLHKEVTRSTQDGFYIVYLFHEEMSKLYLAFAQGVTNTDAETMKKVKEDIRTRIEMNEKVKKDDSVDLGAGQRARGYADSTAAYIEYEAGSLPAEETLVEDLEMMIGYYEAYISFTNKERAYEDSATEIKESPAEFEPKHVVDHIHNYISSKGFYFEKEEVTNLYLSLKTKPFVILSGISGTGKTMIVRWFAESVGATEKNGRFTVIPVRPDWSDGTDLIGFEDLKGDFNRGPVTNVILNAIADPDRPYFVLLDEMNLARVEYYFSDLLSVMESKKWQGGKQVSSRLLPFQLDGMDVYLPSNVYLIGTVNMDETTFPFSKKVLDRANTIEFNRVRLDHLDFLMEAKEKSSIMLHNNRLEAEFLTLKDVYAHTPEFVKEVTNELVRVNEALMENGSHVGYRIRDEISFYMVYNERDGLLTREEAFDLCLLQKILPRLSGSDARMREVLVKLFEVFTNQRINEFAEISEEDIQLAKYPKSTMKVVEMLRGLEQDGFTSFWITS